MYIDTVPNRNSPPAILLREARREGKRTVKTTIANLSKCPPEAIEALRLALKGIQLVPVEDAYAVERSVPHGHVEALLGVMHQLGMETLLASRPCRERDLVLAMMAQRLLDPCSKLATTRQWHATSLAAELNVADADDNELYAALDWLLERQDRIERKLAKRHLDEGARVLYDVSSSSYHGRTCPLAVWGHNRDEEDLPCIVWGLLADGEGRPVAVQTYAGNTGDSSMVADQVDKLRERFGLSRVVLVGDRGMLTQTQIKALKKRPQLGWISALRSEAIQALVEQAFRCIKSLDIRIRPIHHRAVDHVKAHIFLCMLAYYVEWEIRRKLAPVLFQDEELHTARWTRDPVAKAQPGEAVQQKKRTRQTQDGWPVHSLRTLMDELATRCKNICRVGQGKHTARFTTLTEPTDFQRHVFGLLGLKRT